MVNGFDSFREKFKGYEDCYTIIGGTACDVLMNEAGLDFRATKDIDMILLIEERFAEFAAAFWSYVKDGGYKCGWNSSDVPHFYRFTEPQTRGDAVGGDFEGLRKNICCSIKRSVCPQQSK